MSNKPDNINWVREGLEMILSERKTIIRTTALVVFLAVIIVIFKPPIYQATASLLVVGTSPKESPTTLERSPVKERSPEKEDLLSELEILTSPDLLKQVVYVYRQESIEGDMAVETPSTFPRVPDSVQLQPEFAEEVKKLKNSLRTELIPSSRVIKLSLRDEDAKWLEQILDTLVEQYLTYRTIVHYPKDQERFLSEQAEFYKKNVEGIENQLLANAQKTSTTLPDVEMENNIELKMDLSRQLSQLQDEYVQTEILITQVTEAIKNDETEFFTDIDIPGVNAITENLAELTLKRGQAVSHYQETSEVILAIDRLIDETNSLLRSEVERYIGSLTNNLDMLDSRIEHLQKSIQDLEERNIKLQRISLQEKRMQREAELVEYSYNTFSKRQEEARISAAIAKANMSSDVSILSRAASSAEIVSPSKKSLLCVGLICGLLAGFTMAYFRYYFVHTTSHLHRANEGSEVEVGSSFAKSDQQPVQRQNRSSPHTRPVVHRSAYVESGCYDKKLQDKADFDSANASSAPPGMGEWGASPHGQQCKKLPILAQVNEEMKVHATNSPSEFSLVENPSSVTYEEQEKLLILRKIYDENKALRSMNR